MAEDAKEIMNMERGDKKRKIDVVSREVLNLTGGFPPIMPTHSRKYIQGLKEKRLPQGPTEKWEWTPFTNSARKDGLVLYHWRKAGEEQGDYAFAKFNKEIDMVELTEADYDTSTEATNWTKEETFYLWDLCKQFDLRFVVIQDRWDDQKYSERTIEDLKERYYTVSRTLLEKQGLKEHVICKLPYNANYERKRKALMEKYLLRTREHDEEERSLTEEMRKLDAKIKKEEKDLVCYEKLMKSEEPLQMPEWQAGKKEPPKHPFLRSLFTQTPALPNRMDKLIDRVLSDLSLPLRPMPTGQVVEAFDQLKSEIYTLMTLQKQQTKKEKEKKTLEDKILKVRLALTKKTSAPPLLATRMAPTIVATSDAVHVPPQALAVGMKSQTIKPMNNLIMPNMSLRKSKGLSSSDLMDTEEGTPTKRFKKSS
jgi:DNA methyltransferase 1-associated protein 1